MRAATTPQSPTPPAPDAMDIETLSTRLLSLADALAGQVPAIAKARTVKEYDGERRKRLLASYAAPMLEAGEGAAASDTHARAREGYRTEMADMFRQYQTAEATIAEHEATRAQFEAVRSVLSSLKAIAGNV